MNMTYSKGNQTSNGVNKLAEKIKNIFGRRMGSEMIEPKKDRVFNEAMLGVSDIARSILESYRIQTQKNLWHRIFHF